MVVAPMGAAAVQDHREQLIYTALTFLLCEGKKLQINIKQRRGGGGVLLFNIHYPNALTGADQGWYSDSSIKFAINFAIKSCI